MEQEVSVTFNAKHSSDLMVDTRPLGLTGDVPGGAGVLGRAVPPGHPGPHGAAPGTGPGPGRGGGRHPPPGGVSPGPGGDFEPLPAPDLEEELEKTYFETLEQRAKLGFDPRRRQKEREVIDQQVRRRIAQRLTRKRALIGGGVCLGCVVLGALPYFIGSGRQGGTALLWSLLVVVLTLAVCGGFGLAELWIQRKEMADAMEDHNRCMHDTVREVQNSAQHYTGYLSALCTYLRGRSYLDQEAALRSTKSNEEQLSRGHRRAIAKCCALVRSWGAALGAAVEPGLGDKPPAFDAAVAPEENLAYRFPTWNQGRRIPLNQTGETMFSPYDFIRSITLEREELYDDVDAHRDL